MWALVMYGGVVLLIVLVAALLTRRGGRAPGTERGGTASHEGAKAATKNAELGRGGLGH